MKHVAEVSMPNHEQTKMQLDVCLAEYDKLKSEQAQRIAHRDNLVYATLVATGGVVVFAFKQDGDAIGLMVLPLACFVLGWLHTINDEKITSIARYLRTTFRDRISELTADNHPCLLAWESSVRAVKYRRWRKTVELISTLITFVAPGAIALPTYWYLEGTTSWVLWVLVAVTTAEGLLLLVLACEIIRESDIGFVDVLRKRWKTSGKQLPTPTQAPNPGVRADG